MADQMLAQNAYSRGSTPTARDGGARKNRAAPADGSAAASLRDVLADGFNPEDEQGDPNDHAAHDCDSAGCHRIAQDSARSSAPQDQGVAVPQDGGSWGSAVGGAILTPAGSLGGGQIGPALDEGDAGAEGGAGAGGAPAAAPVGASAGVGARVSDSFNATRIAHAAPAFGEVSWNAHDPTAGYRAYVAGGVWRFRLDSLALRVPVGVASGGNTDVPGANDGVVTRATWSTIASDMTPGAAAPRRSPRTTYWSQSLTWRHELFHFAEFNTFLRTSFGLFEDTVEAAGYTEAVQAGDTEATALGRKAADLNTRLLAAWNQAKRNMSPGMEDRAYDDGAASYQALADAVRARATTAGWAP